MENETTALKNRLIELGYIGVFWHKNDIQQAALNHIDRELTEEELDKVAFTLSKGHDANQGINWDIIDITIDICLDEF